MKLSISRGSTSVLFHIFIYDSAATDGSGKTNLAFGDFSCRYIRAGEALSGAITAQDITTIGTYSAPSANTNIRVKKVDDSNMPGWYEVQLHNDWVNTTNSCRTLGIQLRATGASPVNIEIELTGPNNQDAAAFGLTLVPVNVTQLGGDAQSLTDLKDFADSGYDPSTNKVQGVVLVDTITTYTGDTPQTGDSFARLGAPAGASVSADVAAVKSQTAAIEADTAEIGTAGAGLTAVPWNAAWDAEVQSEVTDALNAYDPPTKAELDSAIAPLALEATVAAIDDLLDTEIAAILADTNELQTDWANGGRLDLIVDAIKAKTDLQVSPTRIGTAQAGAAGSITLDSGASSVDDFFNNQLIVLTGGAGAGQARFISDYVGSTKVATVNGNWATNPDNTTTFAVVAFSSIPGATAPTVTEIRQEMDSNSTKLASIEGDTQDIQSRLPAALVSGKMDSSVGAVANDAITAASIHSGAIAEIQSGLALEATAQSILEDTTEIGEAAGVSIAADIAAVKTQTAAIEVDTQDIQGRIPAALVSGRMDASVGSMQNNTVTAAAIATDAVTELQSGLSTLDAAAVRTALGMSSANLDTQLAALPTDTENADTLLKRDWTLISGEASRSALNALRSLRNKVAVVSGTATVMEEDDATPAWTGALTTNPSAEPITAIDPS